MGMRSPKNVATYKSGNILWQGFFGYILWDGYISGCNMPWLRGFWCAAHLFERGLLSEMADEQFLVNIKELRQSMFKHYHYSPKSVMELKGVAEALKENVFKRANLLGTRWAPHMPQTIGNIK